MRRTLRRAAVTSLLALAALAAATSTRAEDGYELWLRYRLVSDPALLATYRAALSQLLLPGDSPTLRVAREELRRGLGGLLGREIAVVSSLDAHAVPAVAGGSGALADGVLVAGTKASCPEIAALGLDAELAAAGPRRLPAPLDDRAWHSGHADRREHRRRRALRRLRAAATAADAAADRRSTTPMAPRIRQRVLDHWDNLDRTVERGYAGFSLWDWHKLPDYRDPRYTDYARANASIGINGTVLTNVNADATSLTPAYLAKAAALADVFRPYGIRVYLSARFSAPIEIGGLKTADPLDPDVAAWWKRKADEIYSLIPDFGGFLVKANSEGQPGPQDYGRTHADGANMLADALAPHGGIVIWRAFVYSHEIPVDRAKQAYDEFQPLDGAFRPNVLVQVKNGPIDFQPREPFHPLFGAMPKTPLMLELQITQEYLGFATHLVFLGPLFEEVLQADTYAKGQGSTVAKVVDGTLDGSRADRHRRRRERRDRPQLVRLRLRLRQLVRLRPPGLGPHGLVRANRRRVATDDVHERLRVPRAGDADDAGFARGGGRLHDAARPRPPDGAQPPLRPGAVGERRAEGGLDLRLLPPCRRGRHRLRPHGDGQQRRQPVRPAGARRVREPRARP